VQPLVLFVAFGLQLAAIDLRPVEQIELPAEPHFEQPMPLVEPR